MVVSLEAKMAAILTINYRLENRAKPWFYKTFASFSDLFKWLREDSVIVIPYGELNLKLEKELLLTKLALPRVRIFILTDSQMEEQHKLFHFIAEDMLNNAIEEAVLNKHKIIDNRENLSTVIKILTE